MLYKLTCHRFKKGLRSLGVLEAIESNACVMNEAFVYSASPLDATAVDSIFEISWSPQGSNRYKNEKRTVNYWRDYLQVLDGMLLFQYMKKYLTSYCKVNKINVVIWKNVQHDIVPDLE